MFPSSSSSVLFLSTFLLVLLSLSALVSSKPLYANHSHPAGWSHAGRAPSTSMHTVTLALQQRNVDVLEEAFNNRTDPTHPHYQQWMSPNELHSITALQPTEVASVLDWLTASGVKPSNGATVTYAAGSDAIVINAQVAHLEAAFNTQLSSYSHAELGQHIRQSLTASSELPDHIAPLVAITRGLTNFPRKLTNALAVSSDGKEWKPADPSLSAYRRTPPAASKGAGRHSFHSMQSYNEYTIVPINVLDRWYGFPDRSATTILDSPTISSGVYEPGNQYFQPNDLSIYSYLQSTTQNRSFLSVPASHIVGNANNPSATPGGEQSLDIQSILALNPQATPYYILDASGGDWYNFALWFQSFPNTQLPQTLSFSWVSTETDYSCTADPSQCNESIDGVTASTYFARMSTEFMKIGLRGITLMAGSGDWGANGLGNLGCNYQQQGTYYLYVSFPSSSPYVLSVGGTNLQGGSGSISPGSEWCNMNQQVATNAGLSVGGVTAPWIFNCPASWSSEIAIDWFGSGGGFSEVYARPAYQNAAVTAYLSQPVTFPPSSYYKSGNRATPDVAIYASSFPIVVGGSFGQVGGTSLASPLWGGVVTLINEIAVKYTGKPVGFVNALLYTMYASDPTTFNDITSGNNANCPNATCVDTCVGFYTAPGYDAVTGLGSPNWPRMSQWLTNYYTRSLGCQGLGYNFSSIGATADLSLVSGGYTYYFRACQPVTSTNCAKTFPNSQVCQDAGSYQYDLADYRPSQMVWSTISNGVQATIQDGQLCGSADRKVVIQYVCSKTATTAKLISVTESPSCTYTLVVNTSITCTAAPAVPAASTTIATCGYNGKNLSPLSQYDLSTVSGGYTWYFRSCAPVNNTVCAAAYPTTQACQVTGSTAWDLAEFLPNSQFATWSTITNGIQYQIQDGQVCGGYDANNQRALTVQYLCSSTATHPTTFTVSEPSTCNYLITIQTSLVC